MTGYLTSGISRLDALIDPQCRGFRFGSHIEALRILAVGPPGAGKSTYCAQIAAEHAAGKGLSGRDRGWTLYITQDESPVSIESRITERARAYLVPVRIVDENGRYKNKVNIKERGLILIGHVNLSITDSIPVHVHQQIKEADEIVVDDKPEFQTMAWVTALLIQLKTIISTLPQDAPGLIIIDSINAFFDRKPESLLRSTLRLLFEGLPVHLHTNVLLVAETLDPSSIEGYLADIILSFERGESYGRRYLTVAKARDHDISPVRHRILLDKDGLRIVPQIAVIHSSQAQEPGKTLPTPPVRAGEPCKFGLSQLDKLLGHNVQVKHRSTEEVMLKRGLARGSITLLVGPPGTKRTLLGLEFLKHGKRGGEHCLFISFVPHHQRFADLGFLDVDAGKQQIDSQINPCPKLIEQVEDQILASAFERKKSPERIVLTNLGFMLNNYGEADVVGMIERLSAMCRIRNVTALAIMSQKVPRKVDEIGEPLYSICDNVLSTGFVGKHGRSSEAIALAVRKIAGVTLSPRFLEMTFDPGKNGVAFDDKFLADVIESDTGILSLGPLRIDYYNGETSSQCEFAEYQKTLLSSYFPGDHKDKPAFVNYGPLKGSRQMSSLPAMVKFNVPFSRRHSTEILMFDQPWTRDIQDRLIPLDEMFTEDDSRYLDNVDANTRSAFTSNDESKTIGFPYYSNFTVLCYRADLIKHFNAKWPLNLEIPYISLNSKLGTFEATQPWTWDDINLIGGMMMNKWSKEHPSLRIFSFSDFSEECYSSLILSMASAVQQPTHGSVLRAIKTGTKQLEALFKQQNCCLPLSATDEKKSRLDPIFIWCWYSQLLEMRRKHPEWSIHCLPIVPNPSGKIQASCSILGPWGFGILDGSVNPDRAMSGIRLMCSREAQREMVRLGAGVPCDEREWDSEWFPNAEQLILKSAKSRSDIVSDYSSFRRELCPKAQALFESLERSSRGRELGHGYVEDVFELNLTKFDSALKALEKVLSASGTKDRH